MHPAATFRRRPQMQSAALTHIHILSQGFQNSRNKRRLEFSKKKFLEPDVPQNDCGIWVSQWMILSCYFGTNHKWVVNDYTRMKLAMDLVNGEQNPKRDTINELAIIDWNQKMQHSVTWPKRDIHQGKGSKESSPTTHQSHVWTMSWHGQNVAHSRKKKACHPPPSITFERDPNVGPLSTPSPHHTKVTFESKREVAQVLQALSSATKATFGPSSRLDPNVVHLSKAQVTALFLRQ
ncbi:hypothetical protein PIB30_074210 [Stylosanthes scabra]|uniref:Ubiquitin-like protease family profile domain-containing protein n=1 Tax=Stylosanthes scabra TaxID=79078 RepID=A0ABU6TSK2_9FABA|nr:hypothetical protein [Stylosanthes scabra]